MEAAEEEGKKAIVAYLSPGGDGDTHWAAGQLSESDIRERTMKKAQSSRKSVIARGNSALLEDEQQGEEQRDSSGNTKPKPKPGRKSSTARKASTKEERKSLTDNSGAVVALSESDVTIDVDGEEAAKMPPPKGCCIVM